MPYPSLKLSYVVWFVSTKYAWKHVIIPKNQKNTNAKIITSIATGAFSIALGSFHTKRWRGGVQRRQMELKGVEGGH